MKKSCSTQNLMHHIELIAKLRHRHLVSVLGHCFECYLDDSTVSRMFFVFEYVPNGELRSWISDGHVGRLLTWEQRISVAIGVAKGIQFLHTGIVPGVYDNNLRITDVLLDNNLAAKISSYNLPLLVEGLGKVGQVVSRKGTPSIKDEDKVDIYDFGVILLELIVGRPLKAKGQVDVLKEQLQASISADDGARRSMVDPAVHRTCSDQSLKTMMEICVRCLLKDPLERPSIEDVLWNLQFASQVQEGWLHNSNPPSIRGSPSPAASSRLHVTTLELPRDSGYEEHERDLPLGIGIALLICCILYMLLSVVIVGLVPYYTLDPDTPISSAFGDSGMQWAAYILTTGAITALCASLLGSLLAQPRIFMAMARDGLLPAFFAEIDPRTQVPVKNTIVIGVLAASLAFFMDVSQLSEMVSVGTLMAFTSVAVCVLVLRYVPPYGVPLPSSSQTWIDKNESRLQTERFLVDATESSDSPLLGARDDKYFGKRRKIAAWSIVLVCIGVLGLSSAASAERLPSLPRFTMCGVSAAILLGSLITLGCIDEDDERHNFGHQGGFLCPVVPYLPVLCILINTYLIINIGVGTWIRVLIWLLVGSMIYLFYGRSHSLLNNVGYVPTTCTGKTTVHLP
ncbi:hypothetical protein F2Q70_00024058 [Brassica cretica]|uniref:Protein kinase domain-containing protein n=1 Tax=Brassica cretica TaxID=69181 RepID=A0A8S9GVP0_BRACR|nr:hypothetical protein F2Q70_00024058 [Brassica cretica]